MDIWTRNTSFSDYIAPPGQKLRNIFYPRLFIGFGGVLYPGRTGRTGGDTVNNCINSLVNSRAFMHTKIPAAVHVPLCAPALGKKEISFFNAFGSNHQTDQARNLLAASQK